MIPATRMAVHHPMANTLVPTAFSYTCCTDLYSSLMVDDVRLPQAVYTNWEVPWSLVHYVYDSGNAHGSSLPHGKHWCKRHFVHLLYGSVYLPDGGRCTATIGCIRKLGGTIVPRTQGVRFWQFASQCTTAWQTLWRKRHLRKSIVRICTALGRQILYGCHRLCTQSGRSLGASYSRCTISATCTADHHPTANTLAQTAFSYTC